MKLSIKIILLIITLVIVLGASFIYISSNLIRDRLYIYQDEWIETLVHAISEGIALNTINGDVLAAREKLQSIVQNDIALEYAYVTDFQGRIFTHTFEKGFPRALFYQHEKDRQVTTKHKHTGERHTPPEELHTLQPIKTTHGNIIDISYPLINGLSSHLHLGVNQNEIISLIQDTNTEIIILVLFLTLIGSIITILFARRITAPLYQLAQSIQSYGKGQLTESINIEKASQEVRDLSNTFATMINERKKIDEEIQKYREHLEDLVEKRTNELATANKELESFSYSISHDLRSPLRAIDGFSLAILEDYADHLDEHGKDFLLRIRTNTQRMGELIDDLLSLSQLTRTPLVLETVNLSTMTKEILLTLSKNQIDRKVNYQVHDTQDIQGDPKLIKIILENLLQNAWKYTSKTIRPEIEFGTKQQNNETVYFVKDNGAGFDMKFSDNLFGVFQRLHGNEFEGTGIGLATVQRLINHHGGRIWAEAAVDQGATFYFILQ